MDLTEIKIKLKQEQDSLAQLEEKKRKLDEKISYRKKKVEDYERLVQSKLYADIDSQLDTLGISREALLEALMSNDLVSLQERIENQFRKEERE